MAADALLCYRQKYLNLWENYKKKVSKKEINVMFLMDSDGCYGAKVNDILMSVMDILGTALFNLVWCVHFCGVR